MAGLRARVIRWLDLDDLRSWVPGVGFALMFFPHGWWRLTGFALWLAMNAHDFFWAWRQKDGRGLVHALLHTIMTVSLAVLLLSAHAGWIVWAIVIGSLVVFFVLVRQEWLRVVTWSELARFVAWCVVLGAVTVAATIVVVHQAEGGISGHARFPYVTGPGLVAVLAVFAVTFAGGLAVFRSQTRWAVLLVAAPFGCMVPWSAIGTTMSAIGAMDPAGVGGLCLSRHPDCSEFAYVAGLIVALCPISLAAIFAAAFGLRKLRGRG